MNNLQYISGGLWADDTPIEKLPDGLIKLNQRLSLRNCLKIKDLNNLTEVNAAINLSNSNIRFSFFRLYHLIQCLNR